MRRGCTRIGDAVAALLFLVAGASPAAGQLSADRIAFSPPPAGNVAEEGGSATTLLLEASAEAGSYLVLPFVWPSDFPKGSGRFTFQPEPEIQVLGTLHGSFKALEDPPLPVLTLLVPANALAGRLFAGAMSYECDEGCSSFEYTAFVEVAPHEGLSIENSRRVIGGGAGDRVRTEVILRNRGNVAERVELVVQLPPLWGGGVIRRGSVDLAPGAMETITVEARIPVATASGDYFGQLTATSARGVTAEAMLGFRVVQNRNSERGARAPHLSFQSAVVRGGEGDLAQAGIFDLNGELFPGVRSSGRFSFVRDGGGTTDSRVDRALGRLGFGRSSASLTLSALEWNADLGRIGRSETGIAAGGVWGEGASLFTSRDRWRFEAYGIQSSYTQGSAKGHRLSLRSTVLVGNLRAGAILMDSRLPGREGTGSRLAALALALPFTLGEASLEVGHRSHESGSGLAYSSSLEFAGDAWSVGGSRTSVPGGRSAEARAETESSLYGAFALGSGITLQGNLWEMDDSSEAAGGGSGFTGWNVGPSLSLGRLGELSAGASSSSSRTLVEVGGFENEDLSLQAGWRIHLGGLTLRAAGSWGTVSRTTDLDLEKRESFIFTARRNTVQAGASLNSRFGNFDVDGYNATTGGGVGFPQRQTTVEVRASMIPLVPGVLMAYAESAATLLDTSGSLGFSHILGLDLWLPRGYSLTLDAEKNAFLVTASSSGGWTLTTKLRKTIALPSFGGTGRSGTVYADLNGNGRRDPGEPGVPGALVRAGSALASTDESGHFRIEGTQQRIDIDPRSLSAGWVVAPRGPQETVLPSNIDLAVRPVSSLEIRIELVEVVGIAPEEIQLDRITIVLRDSSGRSWTATPNVLGVLRFDAIPPGSYEIGADLGPLTGILVSPQEFPLVRVEGGTPPIRVSLPLSTRPIRLAPQSPGVQINRQVRIIPKSGEQVPPGSANAF